MSIAYRYIDTYIYIYRYVLYDGDTNAKWPLTSAKDCIHVFLNLKKEKDFNTGTVCL